VAALQEEVDRRGEFLLNADQKNSLKQFCDMMARGGPPVPDPADRLAIQADRGPATPKSIDPRCLRSANTEVD
jgi:hypothetical protein